mmetsp:Transcript_38/g.55  ORF Transcript_38/g.55 Transcript_38/m.55 type:complete len:274 (-) Transcript_38:183-1004(-)
MFALVVSALFIVESWSLSATLSTSFAKPPKVDLRPKPIVYVYDHCPFCVRVRLALGLKNVEHDIRFMANDDVDLPTSLVGKKIAPIFEVSGREPFAESLDIVRYVDNDPRFGPTGLFKEMSDRSDLKAWQKSVQTPLRMLQRPRYVRTYLPEFAKESARDTFVKNHQLPPYEKADWKSDNLSQLTRLHFYEQAFNDSPKYIAQVNEKLKDLEPLIHCPNCVTEGGLSLDDIDLFSRLRSITIIKGVDLPPGVRAYMEHFAKAGDIPLYDSIAL